MNDYAHSQEAPHFDTARIVRKSRRRRATATAGIAAAALAIGGGTALAAGVTHNSAVVHTAVATVPKNSDTSGLDTTVLFRFSNGKSLPIQLGGMDSTSVRAEFAKVGLHATFTKAPIDGKPGSVIAVEPHSPTVVHQGTTVRVALCAG